MNEADILEGVLCHPLASIAKECSRGPCADAVGGIVRDVLLSNSTDDLDLSVAGHGAQLAQDIAERSNGTAVTLGGDRFSSFRVVAGSALADIWDRHGGSLHADLERRDLTINSIACALDGGGVRDPFGGLADLATRTLRATRIDCFRRDPLRVLRLARFRLTLAGFAIEEATGRAAREAASGLSATASERIRVELERILATASTHAALATLGELGALEVLVPPASEPAVCRSLLDRARRFDRYGALIRSERAAGARPDETAWTAAQQRLAALALIAAGVGAEPWRADSAAFETGGLAARRELRAAGRLRPTELPRDEASRRLFLFERGPSWPLALAVSAACRPGLNEPRVAEIAGALARTANARPELVRGMQPLLDGHAVARILGVAPGPEVGAALEDLLRAQALGRVSTPSEAEAWLRTSGKAPTPQGPTSALPSGVDSDP